MHLDLHATVNPCLKEYSITYLIEWTMKLPTYIVVFYILNISGKKEHHITSFHFISRSGALNLDGLEFVPNFMLDFDTLL